MGLEIERKFLPAGAQWKQAVAGVGGVRIRQGYLSSRKEAVVRVRTMDDKAFLTIKGASSGIDAENGHPGCPDVRAEYEYPIPVHEANAMLDTLAETPPLEKIRYRLPLHGVVWEIDEFMGRLAGLVLIEVELEQVEQALVLPAWVGQEVSGDARYSNAVLARKGSEKGTEGTGCPS